MGRTYSVGTSAPDVVAWYCHTGRSMYDTVGGTMSEPMYLMGDEYALKGDESDVDENDDSGLPDRMWEDDI